jgi:hypothetical protein
MDVSPELLDRIRAEFLERPGLKITTAQACRLWNPHPTHLLRSARRSGRRRLLGPNTVRRVHRAAVGCETSEGRDD